MSRESGSGQGDEYSDILNSKLNKRKADDDILIGHTADEFNLKAGEEITLVLKDSSVLSEGEDILEHTETAKRREYERAKAKDAKFKRRRLGDENSLLDKYDSDEEAPRVRLSSFESDLAAQDKEVNREETLAEGIARVEAEGVSLGESRATLVTDDFYTEEAWESKSKAKGKKKKKVEWRDDDDEAEGLNQGSAAALGTGVQETRRRESTKTASGAVTGNLQGVLAKQQEALKATVYLDTIRKANEKSKHILGEEVGLSGFVPISGKDRLAMLRGVTGKATTSSAPVSVSKLHELMMNKKIEEESTQYEDGDVLELDDEDITLVDNNNNNNNNNNNDNNLQKGKAHARLAMGLGDAEQSIYEQADNNDDYIDSKENEISSRMADTDHVGHVELSLDQRVSGNPMVTAHLLAVARDRGYFCKAFVNRFEGRRTDKVASDALVYTDDTGRELTTKEAFRQISYKFHGYTSFKEQKARQRGGAHAEVKDEAKELRKAQQLLDRLQNRTTFLQKDADGQLRPTPMGRQQLLEYQQRKDARRAELDAQRAAKKQDKPQQPK